MSTRINLRMLGILVISLILVCIFCESRVKAYDFSDTSILEKEDIIYQGIFAQKDISIDVKNNDNKTEITISGNKITPSNIDELYLISEQKDLNSNSIFFKITDNIKKVQYSQLKESNTVQEAEIMEHNGKKYAVINFAEQKDKIQKLANNSYKVYDEKNFNINIVNSKNEVTTENLKFKIDITTETVYTYFIQVISENGISYGKTGGTNGAIMGVGLTGLPTNLDYDNAYIEFLSSEYIGDTVKIDTVGNMPYIGKYGEYYKYRARLRSEYIKNFGENKLLETNRNFSYKGSKPYGDFEIDSSYVINNKVEYKPQTQKNKDTKITFDLQGIFNGTVKATEVDKRDIIYSKVEKELKKYNSDHIELMVSNIYISEGSYNGKLKLTFDVGEQYNGKYYHVVHMVNEKYEFETFEGIVTNGKIEILVGSLSPFGIAISNNDINQEPSVTEKTEQKELDDTPKTGIADYTVYAITTIVAVVIGLISLKNIERSKKRNED